MKIGKATVPRSAICTSNEDHIVVRGADLCDDLIGQIGFGDYFFFLLTGRRPDAAASAVLERDAGRDRRARPGAERAGGAHDAGRRARRDAGRGRGRHPRLRLGDPRRLGDRRAPVRARSTRRRRRTAATCAPPRMRWSPPAARSASRSRATAIRSTSRATRASGALFEVSRECGGGQRFVRDRRGGGGRHSRRHEPRAEAQRLGGDPGGAAGRRLSGGRAEGRADARAHRRPDRPPERGTRATRSASRCPTRPRASYEYTGSAGRLRPGADAS